MNYVFGQISLNIANDFYAKHHRHSKILQGHKFSFALYYMDNIVVCVSVGRPVSRILDNGRILEVTRICSNNAPRNSISFLLSKVIKFIKNSHSYCEKLITYILEYENGSSLLSSNFVFNGHITKARKPSNGWDNRPNRDYQEKVAVFNKKRYEYIMNRKRIDMKRIIRRSLENCAICGSSSPHYVYHLSRNEEVKQSVMLVFDYLSPTQQNKTLFEGHTGTVLLEIFDKLGLNKDDFIFNSAVKCQGHEIDKIADLKGCHQQLLADIKFHMPKKIITFGKVAIQALINRTVSIKEIRQEPIDLGEIVIYSTFSLFQVNNDPNVLKDIVSDLSTFLNPPAQTIDTNIRYDFKTTSRVLEEIKKQGVFALDVETTGLNSFDGITRLLSIAVSTKKAESYVFNTMESGAAYLLNLLKDNSLTMVGHNIKFDYLFLYNCLYNKINVKICDTLTMYILLDENSQDNGLKYLSSILTDIPKNYAKGVDTKKLIDLPLNELYLYNGRDADATLRLYYVLYAELEKQGKLPLLEFLNDVLLTIAHIEINGIYVDKTWAKEKGKEIKAEYKTIEDSYAVIYPDLNLNSTIKLSKILYQDLKLPVLKTTAKGSPSTDTDTLKQLSEMLSEKEDRETEKKFLDDLLVYRKNYKIYETYFEDLDSYIMADGCVHTNYNLGRNSTAKYTKGTVTGRLSCDNPNMTNIPRDKRVKGIFKARDGYKFLDADYSQLELRVGAWYAKEQKMYDLFNKGEDIHTSVLSQILKRPYQELVEILKDDKHKEYSFIKNIRVVAKSINFGIFYGAGANTVQEQARKAGHKITKQEAQEMINKWLKAYPSVAKWIIRTQKEIRENQQISSPTGRTRHLLGADRDDPIGWALIRQGVNFPIQTLASEICLAALVQIEKMIKEKGYDAKIVLTVHDSVLVEFSDKIDCNQFKADIESAMISRVIQYFTKQFNFTLDVPIDISVNITDRWE